MNITVIAIQVTVTEKLKALKALLHWSEATMTLPLKNWTSLA